MRTMKKTGPAGPPVETDTPGDSFKNASKKTKAPVADPDKAMPYPVKKDDKGQQHNPARQAQGNTIRYLR